jgi:hypothetical protein
MWGIAESTAGLHNANNYKNIYIGVIDIVFGIN